MVEFFKNKKINSISNSRLEAFKILLSKISKVLVEERHEAQANVVHDLVLLIEQNSIEEFIKAVNDVGMWGGAGAVWEVYIDDEKKEHEFEISIIALIDLMEQAGIMSKGIKPIRKLFINNQKN